MRTRYLTLILVVLIAAACNKSPNSDVAPTATAASNTTESTDTETEASIALDATMVHACVDKATTSTPIIMDKPDGGLQTDAVFVKGTKWAEGKTLKIFFINGGDYLQGKVLTYARKWANHANLHFAVTNNKSESDIRVGFKVGGDTGSWSYIGTDAQEYHKGEQTMNFGWFNTQTEERELSRTIVHEFGHAIGLGHEQLSPVEEINWNKPKVYQYYMGPPNNWTRAQVDYNIFEKYKAGEVRNTKFDPTSIMQYPVDASLTTDGVAIGWNYYLSDKDKAFIANIYPGKAVTVGEPANF